VERGAAKKVVKSIAPLRQFLMIQEEEIKKSHSRSRSRRRGLRRGGCCRLSVTKDA